MTYNPSNVIEYVTVPAAARATGCNAGRIYYMIRMRKVHFKDTGDSLHKPRYLVRLEDVKHEVGNDEAS